MTATKIGQKRKLGPKRAVGRPIKGRRGLQAKADRLFSILVRNRAGNKCEFCGKSGIMLHCHHGVVHRRYLNTRYELDNAASVCVSCHSYLGDFPRINYEWFKKRIGSDRLEQLEMLARLMDGSKFDYDQAIEVLENKLGGF